MDYDAVIIGAGMSGLAAGIRLAYFDRRVLILERHEVYGGLNSFYTLGGRKFDVGLHAVTNFVPEGNRSAPLAKLLRQLRLDRDELALCPQGYSEVRFPGRRLRFANGLGLLVEDVAAEFPSQVDRFGRLVDVIRAHDDVSLDQQPASSRRVLADFLSDPALIEMLLCPICYYGSSIENDIDFSQFVILFKALFCEGFARPKEGVRAILTALVKKFRRCGGQLRTRCGVQRICHDGERVEGLLLDNGETVTADLVFSSAGLPETMAMCSATKEQPAQQAHRLKTGAARGMTFFESISCLDVLPAALGHQATIVFFNDAERFTYAHPHGLIDPTSGVCCCPNNYTDHGHLPEGQIRLTSLANYDGWAALEPDAYVRAKDECYQRAADCVVKFVPEFRSHVVYRDSFTPCTVEHFTGHFGGAIYGSPHKVRDGRTSLKNLFICGTDQGFLGIVGAMLSGISMANLHGLASRPLAG